MSMREQLATFGEQFAWDIPIEYADSLKPSYDQYILCGMGGSALGARLLLAHDPLLPLRIHNGYGLPAFREDELGKSILILSSYSGNTEEVLDVAAHAVEQNIPVCIVTSGGALEAFGRAHSLPMMIFMPPDMEPRMAIGYTMLAIVRLMNLATLETVIRRAGLEVQPEQHRAPGNAIGESLQGRIPFVYSSAENSGIAYFWKIAFNETSKIPSSYNLMSELCHNELSGFDFIAGHGMPENAYPIFITDNADHPRIQTRMSLMQELLNEKGIAYTKSSLDGANHFNKAFASIMTAVWAAITLADYYGVPDAKTPLIAEFKQRLRATPL